MTPATRRLPVVTRQPPGRRPVGHARLAELRARLAQECSRDDSSHPSVRVAVAAAVRPLVGAGPLIDTTAVRSADDADLVRCAQTVQQAINILEAARSTLAAETARRRLHTRRGEATSAETLTNATALSAVLARRVEREAQALDAQPTVAAVLARGEITSEQAAAVAGADVPDSVRSDLCEQAKHQTADQTRRAVRAAQAAQRRESDAQRRTRQRAARSASMWTDPDDGMWHLRAKLDALAGDAVNRLLVRAVQQNWRSDKDLPESQRRTAPQRAADALVQLLTTTKDHTAKPAHRDTAPPDAARPAAAAPRSGAADTDAAAADPATSGTATEPTADDAATEPTAGASTTEPATGDAAAGSVAGSAAGEQPTGDAAADPITGDTATGPTANDAATEPAAGDVAAEQTTGEAAAEPAAGKAATGPVASTDAAEPAASDAETVAGVGVIDDGWVTPNASQMIVLTTLDNLRSPPSDQTPVASGNGEPQPPLLALPVPTAPDAKPPDTATAPADRLLAVPGAAALTETGTVLDAADLRKIACDTRIIPVVMGGVSEVLDIGRATRTISPALRRALIARDQGCVWPGCERAPIHCDGHHLQHWVDDGPTCLSNLALLCHTHHISLHRHNLVLHPPTRPAPPGEGWTVTPAPSCKPRTPTGDHVRQNR